MPLREALTADIPILRALEAQAETAAHWTAGTWEGLFQPGGLRRLVLVLEEGASVLAFAIVLCLENEWEIENIVVAGDARRRGLGRQLLKEALRRAQEAGAHAMFLEVRESNQAARALYERAAFRMTGRRTGYYSTPSEDAILYRFDFSAGKP